MRNSEILDKLNKTIDYIVGIERFTYPEKVGGRKPDSDYCVTNVISNGNIFLEQTSYRNQLPSEGEDVIVEIEGLRNVIVSINFYHADSSYYANKVHLNMRRPDVISRLTHDGLGYIERSAVRPIPDVVDGEWELRNQFDLTLSIKEQDEAVIPVINSATIKGKLEETPVEINIQEAN